MEPSTRCCAKHNRVPKSLYPDYRPKMRAAKGEGSATREEIAEHADGLVSWPEQTGAIPRNRIA